MTLLKTGGAALSLLLLAGAVMGPAQAQTRYVPVPQVPSQGVPGQNLAPPAPRQNLAPPPMRTPRPGEGDSTTRIQSDYNSRLPSPATPSR